ncbi:MAG: AEC family transporter [Thiohalophilus sp.]|uniref:AEC family transporter n=1 Tax=Thiohalophilus sp. TaxID=3028392 RepID=UPI00286FC220|nr:AEC family transporter [Thiohalophilus sp.]MDR9436362.1 AEC family transporter [Thiohalophilus sp.]
MVNILFSMMVIIACGALWRYFAPGGVDGDKARQVITGLVYNLLLPALILSILWQAPLGISSIKISALASLGILAGLLFAWLACRGCGMPRPVTGAVMLAAAFPNANYLGLPVLVSVFGEWSASIAIQYDLFASTPLLFTLGILLAQQFGQVASRESIGHRLLRIPPLWAALLAVVLNLTGVPVPELLQNTLSLLGESVIPLMLLVLGMSLRWEVLRWQRLPSVIVVVISQLIIMPLVVWGGAGVLNLDARLLAPVVLEAAMPSMVIGVVICDRYGLDTTVYAAAVTVSTLLSLLSLPLWYGWLPV